MISGRNTREHEALERLVDELEPGSTVLRTSKLTGGISAEVTAVEIERSDGSRWRCVVRRYGERDLAQKPDVAQDEFRLLEILHSAGVPVPKPHHVDATGTIFPGPSLTIEFIEHDPAARPESIESFLEQVATLLARIHSLPFSVSDVSFLPEKHAAVERLLADASGATPNALTRSIVEALNSVWPREPRNGAVLLHGDYWPGNILWRDGEIAAVIDWEDAAIGDPLADVANVRLELLWEYGFDTMHQFTDLYRSMMAIDLTDLPYWDLVAALNPASQLENWGLDEETSASMMERLEQFVGLARQSVSGQ